MTTRSVLSVIMDGVGVRKSSFGNAVSFAQTPHLDFLQKKGLYRNLFAHGPYVGLPTKQDMGNSEVGHNALGAGRIFDQGALLVQRAVASGAIFKGSVWRQICQFVEKRPGNLHFIGLLSDGNVHSHEDHLFAMVREAVACGISCRIHVLFDGRDVAAKSAEVYVDHLEKELTRLRMAHPKADIQVASGGGRMVTTMDRYEADWRIVEAGWRAHVLAQADLEFGSLAEALAFFRRDSSLSDQYFPPFVIKNDRGPAGPIEDGDGVIFFNFRGDRAIEISRAFVEKSFVAFDRVRFPKVFFAGMMQYDGDLQIPPHFLVEPPVIEDTLGSWLAELKVRQFACSETQKFGHVTYFWNGNRSGYFDQNVEAYHEVASDRMAFDLKPWMKAFEITEVTLKAMLEGSFDFGRINFANGDMVGHTGNFEAAVIAVATIDMMLGRIIAACQKTGTILVVTADHGNCDEMFDSEEIANWQGAALSQRPPPKTSHTLNPVPLYIWDPVDSNRWKLSSIEEGTLGHFANTVLTLLGLEKRALYLDSLVEAII